MSLYVVRHAKAGSRTDWEGDDRLRPLSAKGRRQAEALADALTPLAPSRLLSSPYLRCRETLEPVAARCDMEILNDDRLAEGTPFTEVLDLLAESPDATVLCSHGDVIPELLDALVRRGMHVVGEPDWRKATVWVLERDTTGTVVEGHVWPPPAV